MNTNYNTSLSYEWLMLIAYLGSSETGNYRNSFMQSLLIHEDGHDIMTKATYKQSFQKVQANVIKGLSVLNNKTRNLKVFIDEAKKCSTACNLNSICKKVVDMNIKH